MLSFTIFVTDSMKKSISISGMHNLLVERAILAAFLSTRNKTVLFFDVLKALTPSKAP